MGSNAQTRRRATDEFLAQVAPLVADDPYRGLIASHASEPGQRKEALEELVKVNTRVEGLEVRALAVLDAYADFDHAA